MKRWWYLNLLLEIAMILEIRRNRKINKARRIAGLDTDKPVGF